MFQTNAENLLDAWVAQDLPALSVEVSKRTLLVEFLRVLDFDDSKGEVFDGLKAEVRQQCANAFKWDPRSVSKLKSVQELTLRDDVIKDKRDWDRAVRFMMDKLEAELKEVLQTQATALGPGAWTRWLRWQSTTAEQARLRLVQHELKPYVAGGRADATSAAAASRGGGGGSGDGSRRMVPASGLRASLTDDEVQSVVLSIKRAHKVDVDEEAVRSMYQTMYKASFLDRSLKSAAYCQSKFGAVDAAAGEGGGSSPANGLRCSDVLLFWRVHNMLSATGNMLRLEAMSYKKDLEEEARDVLNNIAGDRAAKQRLIVGRRVTLAEEIEVLRHIQAKLEQFVKLQRKEGRSGSATGL